MKTMLKWFSIACGIFLVAIIAAVFIIPQFIDVRKYKPMIEQKVTEATGRSFTLGNDMDVSLFPWVGVKLTDLHLGNPTGFVEKDMISVLNFEVRLKVMPLLSKRIEVKTFVINSPKIYLETLKNGDANWQGIGAENTKKESREQKNQKPGESRELPIQALMVDHFSITNGEVIYIDQKTDKKNKISDLNLDLANISFEDLVGIQLSAKLDGKPVWVEGSAGPIGKEPGKGSIALDFVFKALDELEMKLKGTLMDPMVSPGFDFEVDVSTFSPRKLFAAMNIDFPVKTKDPKVLDSISFKTKIKGNKDKIALSDGLLLLDDSKLMFSAKAKEFLKPDLTFDFQLDEIDFDRYLPETKAKNEESGSGNTSSGKAATIKAGNKKTDYTPLRKLLLDGKIRLGKAKAHGAIMKDFDMHILAKNGIINIDPMGLNLYQGSIASKLKLNVQKDNPLTEVSMDAKGIQAGPLLKDTMQKELIEGTLHTSIDFSMKGETPDMIKQTISGLGELLFTDGAVIGIDLANAVRNVKSRLGSGEQLAKKPRTDFAELKIPFTIQQGLVNTGGASLISPFIRVLVTGKTHLVKEWLDFRVEPKFVATLKGQGDTKQRSGFMVPLLITGSFSAPKILPDLKGMLGSSLPDKEGLQKILKTEEGSEEQVESVKGEVKKQIKGMIPGLLD